LAFDIAMELVHRLRHLFFLVARLYKPPFKLIFARPQLLDAFLGRVVGKFADNLLSKFSDKCNELRQSISSSFSFKARKLAELGAHPLGKRMSLARGD